MKPGNRGRLFRHVGGLVFFAIAGTILLWGQIEPDDPVRNFTLPRFGEDGDRLWVLRGQQGSYAGEHRIQVTGMQLRIFDRDNPEELSLQIESPQAIIHTNENRARGAGSLLVLSPEFSIAGRNWEWDGDRDTVTVHENARVAFSENLTDILR